MEFNELKEIGLIQEKRIRSFIGKYICSMQYMLEPNEKSAKSQLFDRPISSYLTGPPFTAISIVENLIH